MSTSDEGIFVVFFSNLANCSHCTMQGDGSSPLVPTSVLGKGVKHRPPPIKMPSGSGSSSSGTRFTTSPRYQHAFVACHFFILFFMKITTFPRVIQKTFGSSVNSLNEVVMINFWKLLWDNQRQPKLSGLWQTLFLLIFYKLVRTDLVILQSENGPSGHPKSFSII